MSKLLNRVLAATSATETRNETLHGRDYLVVPIVAMVEGVRVPGNVNKAELGLISEFRKSLDSWNGRPIVLNHPHDGDDSISANSPSVYDEYACGLIFNSSIDGKKLKMEAWIDLAHAETQGGDFQGVVDRINEGEIVEVSTGFCCDTDNIKGRYCGVDYEAVWRNITPDHLALLPDLIGACSVKDGCGTRNNDSNSNVDTLSDRRLIPLPIALHSEVRVATAKKLHNDVATPSDCCDGKELKCEKCAVTNATEVAEATNRATNSNSDKSDAKVRAVLRKFIAASSGVSASDLMYSLQEAIEETYPYAMIVDLFDASFIIFDWMSGEGMIELNFTKDDQGAVNVDFGSAVEVRPLTKYVPVASGDDSAAKNNSTENEMPNEIKPTENAATTAALAPIVPVAPVAVEVKTLNEYIETAPEGFRGELKVLVTQGQTRINEIQARMGTQITAILSNPKNEFTEAELRKLDSSAVEKLFKMAGENIIPATAGDVSPTQTRNENAANGTVAGAPPAATRANLEADDKNVIVAPRALSVALKEQNANKNGARA